MGESRVSTETLTYNLSQFRSLLAKAMDDLRAGNYTNLDQLLGQADLIASSSFSIPCPLSHRNEQTKAILNSLQTADLAMMPLSEIKNSEARHCIGNCDFWTMVWMNGELVLAVDSSSSNAEQDIRSTQLHRAIQRGMSYLASQLTAISHNCGHPGPSKSEDSSAEHKTPQSPAGRTSKAKEHPGRFTRKTRATASKLEEKTKDSRDHQASQIINGILQQVAKELRIGHRECDACGRVLILHRGQSGLLPPTVPVIMDSTVIVQGKTSTKDNSLSRDKNHCPIEYFHIECLEDYLHSIRLSSDS